MNDSIADFTATPARRIAPAHLRLDQVVGHWAAIRPEDGVLFDDAGTLTWREFAADIERSAAILAGLVAPGTPVAVVCVNEAPFHVLLNALWRVGAGVILLDRNWGPALLRDILALLDCRTVFASRPVAVPAGVALRTYPVQGAAVDLPADTHGIDHIALYASTSGTTDNPKCVAISHRKLRSAYRGCLAIHDFSSIARAACLFDINSLGVLGVCFLLPREVGAGTRLLPSFSMANVRSSWQTVLNERCDFVYLVPPLVRLLNTLPAAPEDAPRLLAFCSAAPVAEAELRRLEAHYPLQVFNCYGLTELCFAVFFGCRADDGLASGSIGPALAVQARLVDDDGALLSGAGRGELYLTGPMQTGAYLHNPRATQESWREGWLATGDIAERDAQGRYHIRGRKKDMVLRGGYTYYLHELEHYLRRAPEVVDACAFKGRDLPSGDELCIVVQVSGNTSVAALTHWLRHNLGAARLPNALYMIRRGLPRNSNGKVLRTMLAAMHLDGTLAEWEAR